MRHLFHVTQPGATQEQLQSLLHELGYALPKVYLQFLAASNGAEWCVHDNDEGRRGDCLKIWPAGEVVRWNRAYQIQRWIPLALAIADNGGDDTFVLDRSTAESPDLWPVFRVGFGALAPEEMQLQAETFADWAKNEFRTYGYTN